MSKLCVAIQARSPEELIERAEAALFESQADARFIELRLDSLPKPAAALPKVEKYLAAHREVTVIATCRRKKFGGSFNGSLAAELDLLTKAAQAGCKIVDLEVESAEEATFRQLEQFREKLAHRGHGAACQLSRLHADQEPGTGRATHRGLPPGFRQGGFDGPLPF